MVVTGLAVAAAAWGVLMGVSPVTAAAPEAGQALEAMAPPPPPVMARAYAKGCTGR